jgi:hypothetical protein
LALNRFNNGIGFVIALGNACKIVTQRRPASGQLFATLNNGRRFLLSSPPTK